MIDVRYINLDHRRDRRRMMERQLRWHGIDARRVTALDETRGRALLPHSTRRRGELGLLATWVSMLEQIEIEGAREGAEWLVVLEDDAILLPRFLARVEEALSLAPPSCDFVQLASLTKYTLYSQRALSEMPKFWLLFLLRREWTDRARRIGGGPDPLFSNVVDLGAHAMAVRVSAIPWLLEILRPADAPVDLMFMFASKREPGRLLRFRRQLAYQQALLPSDIQNPRGGARSRGPRFDARYINLSTRPGRRRLMEAQQRLHRLDLMRVEASRPEEAAAVLPDATALPSECGLLATWVKIFTDVLDNGPRHDAGWLLVFEDDAILMPYFTSRAKAVLGAAPRECLVVQLGSLTGYTLVRPDGWRVNARRALRYVTHRRWRRSVRHLGGGDDLTFSTDIHWGSHAMAFRVSGLGELLTHLPPWDGPTDDLIRRFAEQQPGRVLRYRRQLAFQAPFDSDTHLERMTLRFGGSRARRRSHGARSR